MILNVRERLALLSILPKEGNFINLKLIRVLREELSFSEEESEVLKFKQSEGIINWIEANDPMKNIVIGEIINALIVDILKTKDRDNKLTEDYISLYEKFIISNN
jgi:hypothetical protein